MMLVRRLRWLPTLLITLASAAAHADKYTDTIKIFRDAGTSGGFFHHCYGYAVFPTIGKGGIGVGGAHGSGRVYAGGEYTGDVSLTQLRACRQLGGQAYSQIEFFQEKRAVDELTGGSFEFGAQAAAGPITARAPARTARGGARAG